jgi:hypothetical protein
MVAAGDAGWDPPPWHVEQAEGELYAWLTSTNRWTVAGFEAEVERLTVQYLEGSGFAPRPAAPLPPVPPSRVVPSPRAGGIAEAVALGAARAWERAARR